MAVPVSSPNGCGPLAQGLGGKAAEGQGTSDLSLRQIEGKRDRKVQSHPGNKEGLRVLTSSIGERGGLHIGGAEEPSFMKELRGTLWDG